MIESYGFTLPDLNNYPAKPWLFKLTKPASTKTILANFRQVDPLCPPLYALSMNRWLTFFGNSDLAIRSFSAILSIISILITYFIGQALLGKPAGEMAALIQAISPFDIGYAQEARMYTLVFLLSAIVLGSVALFCLRGKKYFLWLIPYIFATWALVNTHYTGLFIWASAILIGFILAFLQKDWRLAAWLLGANLAAALLCLPWYPLFVQAAQVRAASFYVSRTPTLWWPIVALFFKIPLNWLGFLSGKRVMTFAAPIYFLASVILCFGFKPLLEELKNKFLSSYSTLNKNLSLAVLLIGWCLIPPCCIWLLDVLESHRVVEIPRYLIGTAPAIFLIAGLGVIKILENKKLGSLVIIFYAFFALANNAYAHIIHQKEDWRAVASLVTKCCKQNEPLLVSQYYDIVCLDRYLNQPLRQIGISPNLGANKISDLLNNKIAAQSFWLLTAQEGDGIFSLIPNNYQVIERYDMPHALHLRHYQRSLSK